MLRCPCQFPRAILLVAVIFTGCGTTKSRVATEQLLVSDAVDYAVSSIDFRIMAGHKVFLDSTYIRNVKSAGFVNADYIISSLRQQMIGADCRLVENRGDAEFIVEARVGTLGTDGNEVSFGIPASNALSSAVTLVSGAPVIPSIPEISFARKEGQVGAVKIAVFAYERETGRPIWQSGIARARSTSRDFWLFGAGPFQNGSIHHGMRFAGEQLRIPALDAGNTNHTRSAVAYDGPYVFHDPEAENQAVLQASFSRKEPAKSVDNPTAKPIQLWGVGGKISTPLEADLEQSFRTIP